MNDIEAIAEARAIAIYEVVNDDVAHRTPWNYLPPGECEKWRRAANVAQQMTVPQEPVAIYCGDDMTRHTIEFTNGLIPIGTELFSRPIDGELRAAITNFRASQESAPMPTSEEMEEMVFGQQVAVPQSSMSWSGFNLLGNAESIAEARRLLHEAGTVPELRQRIRDNEQQVADAENYRSMGGRPAPEATD